jgi:succinate dehydrogenase hydrophobic anchor subunit
MISITIAKVSSTYDSIIIFVGGIIFTFLGAGYCFFPKKTWHLLNGLFLARPEYHEPSKLGYAFQRFIGFLSMVMGVFSLFSIFARK